MSDAYNLTFSLVNFDNALAQVREFNAELKKLQSSGSLSSGAKDVTAIVKSFGSATKKIEDLTSRVKEQSASLVDFTVKAKSASKSMEQVGAGAAKGVAKLRDVKKNFDFSELKKSVRELRSAGQLAESSIDSMSKKYRSWQKQVQAVAKDPSLKNAFGQVYGSSAQRELSKINGYMREGNALLSQQRKSLQALKAEQNTRTLAKQQISASAEDAKITKQKEAATRALAKAQMAALSEDTRLSAASYNSATRALSVGEAYKASLAPLQSSVTLEATRTATLKRSLDYLQKIQREHSVITTMPTGQQKAATKVFSSKYGTDALVQAQSGQLQKSINSLQAEYDVRQKSILTKQVQHNGLLATAHNTWRGIAAATGNIWMSWGNFAPMLAGVAGAGAVIKSMTVGKDFGWQMEMVGVAAEAGETKVKELSAQVLAMGSQNTLQGPMQMASALRVLAQAGFDTKEALTALPTVLNLGLVAEVSDDDSAKFLAGLKSSFNLDSGNGLREAADQTAKAAAVSQTSIEKMMEALKQSSAEAARFGLSVSDASTALAILAKYNIEGSAAGTSFKNFLTDLSGRTPKATKALKELGLSFYDAQGMAKPLMTVVAELQQKLGGMTDANQQKWLKSIFNERGLKTASILLSEAGKEFASLHAEISRAGENMGYTTTQAERLGQTSEGAFRKMKNSWEGMFASVGTGAEGSFKSLMQSMTDLANNDNTRQAILTLTKTFLSLATATAEVVKVLTPLTPLLSGLGAAASTYALVKWLGTFQAIKAVVAGGVTLFGSLRTAMGLTAAATVATSTAMAATGTAATAASVGVKALQVAMGPAGWISLAVGGIITYMALAQSKTTSFREELDKLDKSLGSVSTEKYEQFNTKGFGLQLDKDLGIGYQTNSKYQLSTDSSMTTFEENRKKIDEAVKASLAQADAMYKTSTNDRLEQETMLLDRKKSLLTDELKNFDAATSSQVELDAQSKQIRAGYEQDLDDLSVKLMNNRTELALEQLRQIQVEAVKNANVFEQMYRWLTNADDAAQQRWDSIQKNGVKGSRDIEMKAMVSNGMSVQEAAARTGSTMTKEAVTAIVKQLQSVGGYKTVLGESQSTPMGAVQVKNAIMALEDQAKRPSAAANAGKSQAALAQEAGQRRLALEKLYSIQRQLQDSAKPDLTRANPDLKLGTPQFGGGVGASKSVPTYSGVSTESLKVQNLKAQQSQIEAQIDAKVRSQGYIATDDELLTQRLLTAEQIDQAILGKSNESAKKQLEKAKAFVAKGEGSAEDLAKAREDIQYLQAQLTKSVVSGTSASIAKLWSSSAGKQVLSHAQTYNYAALESKYNIPQNTLAALEMTESRGNARARSPVGASGAFQFMPASAKHWGVDTTSVQSSAEGAAKYMAYLLKMFNGDLEKAVNAYNWGEGSVKKALTRSQRTGSYAVPKETQGHWKQVKESRAALSGNLPTTSAPGESASNTSSALAKNAELRAKAAALTSEQEKRQYELSKFNLDIMKQRGDLSEKGYNLATMTLEVSRLQAEQEQKINELKAGGGSENDNDPLNSITMVKADYAAQIDKVAQSYEAAKAAQESWRVGLSTSYNALVDESTNYGSYASQAFNAVAEGVVGSLQTLATTGKLSFRDMAASIMSDLAKIAMRMAALKLMDYIGSAFGGTSTVNTGMDNLFATGGAFGQGGVQYFANGGTFTNSVVDKPTMFKSGGMLGVMGEAGPEAILPLTRMGDGNLGVQTSGGFGGGTNVNSPVNVSVNVNNDGSADTDVSSTSKMGKQLGSAVKVAVQAEMLKQTRPGGLLYSKSK